MLVMPLFFDQYNNAQRMQEKGFGVRLEPNEFTEEQLIETIDRLLADVELEKRCQQAADIVKQSDT